MITMPPVRKTDRLDKGLDPTAPRRDDPSPQQIAEATAAIRAGWSERERQKRAVDETLVSRRPETPEVSVGDLGMDVIAKDFDWGLW